MSARLVSYSGLVLGAAAIIATTGCAPSAPPPPAPPAAHAAGPTQVPPRPPGSPPLPKCVAGMMGDCTK